MNAFHLNVTIKKILHKSGCGCSVSNARCYQGKAFYKYISLHTQTGQGWDCRRLAQQIPWTHTHTHTHTHTESYQSSLRSTLSWTVYVGSLKTCVLDWLLFHCAEWLSLRDLRLGNTRCGEWTLHLCLTHTLARMGSRALTHTHTHTHYTDI